MKEADPLTHPIATTSRQRTALLRAAAGVGSDGDLSRLLVTVARQQHLEGDLHRAYLRTAQGIGSESDRRRAVEAL